MSRGMLQEGIVPGRLTSEQLDENFADLHPPIGQHEAFVEADKCYFCFDAPCQNACPTDIDIPLFIREISTGNTLGAAKTIFNQNILGGMCARVCPTETLCEEVCVREAAEGKPVKIGFLQRFATDQALAKNARFYQRAAETGKKIAVVGAGPAGLACAHRLALHGHQVLILDAEQKAGGLNEYGIASYKTVDKFAQREVDYVTQIGGITIKSGQALGRDFTLEQLSLDYDAVFLGFGLGGVNALRAEGDQASGVVDAVDFIRDLRQADNLADIKIGRHVIVIGGGMTAIDAAIQAKLLGADEVTICYRRGVEQMNASRFEQDLAVSKGVVIRHWVQPKTVKNHNNSVSALELEHTHLVDGKLQGLGHGPTLVADQIFVAIGQKLEAALTDGLELVDGRLKVDEFGRTSRSGVWAGGDCIAGGDDLTVSAVAQGRDAAMDIHASLR